jgi:hypothetical protein
MQLRRRHPCPVCNVADPPAMPDSFVRDEEADGEYQTLLNAVNRLLK